MSIIKKIIFLIIIISLIIIIIYLVNTKITLENNKIIADDLIIQNENLVFDEDSSSAEKYKVDIKGAVKNPGVYEIPTNYVINDVIKEAGGLAKNADTSLINLSKKVSNEMVIIIYTKEEVKKSNIVDTVIKVVEKECVCPNIQNDGCINDKITDSITNQESSLININEANEEELLKIPGIGTSKAKAIIEYRKQNRFNTIEDIMNVSGIGSSLYETIKIYITT